MSDSNPAAPPSPPRERRKSFVEMLNPRAFTNSASISTSAPSNPIPTSPGPANNRKSISMALGLSGGGSSQDSPYNTFARQRRASISTISTSGSPELRHSFDEGAIIEDDDKIGPINSPPSPSFARRLSFGAQALRERQGGTSPNNNAGRRPSSSLFTLKEDADHSNANNHHLKPGTAKTGGEGFNWTEAMRDRNKRASISGNPFAANGHNRSKSFNVPATEPPKEMPKPEPPASVPTARIKKPDHLGERMLRGDFMMD